MASKVYGKSVKIGKGEKLLMIGDSVTDAGRTRPVSEGLFNPHGAGYPNIVYGMITSVYTDLMIRVVNMGNSGDTVRNLKERWQTDVIDLKPDWVSIMIGVNDVWRQFDVQSMPELHVLPDEYRKTLSELVGRTRPLVKGIFLMTPVYWETNLKDAMGARVREYGAICREIAEAQGIFFVDAQSYADRMLAGCAHSSFVAWDRVHPNIPGHHCIAHALLDAMDFDYNRQG